jgi:ADP-heptose:LPS heptosyltransferase
MADIAVEGLDRLLTIRVNLLILRFPLRKMDIKLRQVTTISGDMLVAAPESWDEACFAVPAVRALIASGLKTGVLCSEAQREFWETIDDLAVVHFPLRTKSKLVAIQIKEKWEASLAWENGLAAEAFKIANLKRRLGPQERKLNKLLTHPLNISENSLEHRVRHYLAAVEELGIDTKRPEFFASADLEIEVEKDAVILCPSSDFGPSHEWPLERWMEIATRLLESGKHITVVSLDGSRDLGKNLANALGEKATSFHAFPLVGTLPILAVHSLVISADGSLPHLSAHAGATCVTLFGPNDPAWKRPLGRRHSVVRRHVECAPCLLAKCPLDSRCQKELTADRVWEAVAEKLTSTP